jgi:ATP-dependent Lon protease
LEEHGINKRILKITDSGLKNLISQYTREAGVRNLEFTVLRSVNQGGNSRASQAGRRM